jgi:hypothetical protein
MYNAQSQTDGNNPKRISKIPLPTMTNETFSQIVPYGNKSAADNQNIPRKIR